MQYRFLRSLGQLSICLALCAFIAAPAQAVDPDQATYKNIILTLGQEELQCLAEAVYFEARGESDMGQRAVAQVVMNRTGNDAYPKSICGVVYQNQNRRNACQFSFACDGRPEVKNEAAAWQKATNIARQIASGEMQTPVLKTATHYHASYAKPSWARKMTRLSKIGLHVFYREDRS